MMILKNKICIRVIKTIMLLLLLTSCKEKNDENTTPKHYPTEILVPVNREIEVQYPAILKGRQSVEIRPQCSGLITRICINEGAQVKKGQILFIIDRAPYIAALRIASANVSQAETQLAAAQLTLNSKEALFKENIISEYELQMARNEVKAAKAVLNQTKAHYDNARSELSHTEVRSPVDGVAGMIPYRVGELVDKNIVKPLVCVSDTEEMFAYFSVPESDELINNVSRGTQKIAFRSVNETTPVVSGIIDATSGIVDATTGTVNIRARIPNHDKILHDGSTGSVIVSTKKSNCIVIPHTATYEIQNRIFAYKVIDRRAVSTAIEVEDIGNGKEYIVLSGLKAGDKIVTEGSGLLQEGTEITERLTSKKFTR